MGEKIEERWGKSQITSHKKGRQKGGKQVRKKAEKLREKSPKKVHVLICSAVIAEE